MKQENVREEDSDERRKRGVRKKKVKVEKKEVGKRKYERGKEREEENEPRREAMKPRQKQRKTKQNSDAQNYIHLNPQRSMSSAPLTPRAYTLQNRSSSTRKYDGGFYFVLCS